MLEEVLDLLALGIVLHDHDGYFLFANATARGQRHDCEEIAALVSRASAEPGVAFVARRGTEQLCSIALNEQIVTFLTRPHECPDLTLAAVLYGLTSRERTVAHLLGSGHSARSSATVLETTLHTIHSHLKRLFAKTRTNSQNELIAILRGGIPLSRCTSIKGYTNNHEPLHSQTVQLEQTMK